ncbi:membrane protein YczE [Candidatus Pelagibacter sp. FZCC0015]|uniref:membrane protein YczE n=1 Tax=Candidatus Pelagibacter sp. FZCC0015 TaxID=2268451 RepID=UPI00119DF5B5|nr:YitT family protein [Candidatus Pelagibacter sp. FZCC0015]
MFLKIKKIPKVKWSSEKPFNFKPKFSTFFFLCFGLSLFGLGEGLLIVSFTGASPWSVLAQGISLNVNLSIGTITLLISIAVLILWIPLGQKPGMGTIFNALIIAIMIDLCIKYVPTPSNYIHQLLLAVISVIMVGIGGGIYLVSNLGAGPRDGLMIGLQKLTNFPIAVVRAILEISVVSIGWYLGGTVGVGTLLFAFGIGPCVALGLYLVDKTFD